MSHLHVNRRLPPGAALARVLRERAPRLTLPWELRQRSRFEAVDDAGQPLAVVLDRGQVLRGGDMLVAADGSLRQVVAAPQAVLVVTACPAHGRPFDLMRAAYHLGNRHVALQLAPQRLLLEPDPVLAELMQRMQLVVEEAMEAFEPELGAYGRSAMLGHGDVRGHGQGHGHGDGHGH